MKFKSNLFLAASITSMVAFVPTASRGAVVWKAGNTNNLNLTTSWWTTEAGTTNPASIGATDTLRFGGSGQGSSMTSLLLGGNLTVGALRLDNNTGTPNYNVTIASGSTLTLNGNTDYAAAPVQGIVLNSAAGGTLTVNADIALGASQRWVASRNLTVGGNVALGANTLTLHCAAGTTAVSGVISGTGGVTKDSGNAGIVALLTGSNTYTGSTFVNLGTLRVTGSGVLGGASGSSADAGNIVFSAANANAALEFETSANLGPASQIRFRNTGGTAGSGGNLKYIGTTAQTLGKTLQCDSGVGIRLESDSVGGSLTFNGGFSQTNRPLFLGGTGTGDNNFASAYTGTSAVTKNGTGKWTLSGANTYTGATNVTAGRLNLTGSLTSATNVSSGATLSGTGSTTGLLTMNAGSSITLAGGASTTSLTSNGVTFAGATSVKFDALPVSSTVYDILTYGTGAVTTPANLTVPFRGTLTNDTTNKKFTFTAGAYGETRTWNTTSGTWEPGGTSTNWLEGDLKFYNGDAAIFGDIASDSAITLSGRLAPASVTVGNSANKYTFTGAAGTADITGSTSLIKNNGGTLAVASQQTYTGGTTINGGTLDLTGGGGASGAIRGTVNVNSGASLKLSTTDALGYNNDATVVNVVNLTGSTMTAASGTNQTTTAKFYLTGATIDGTVNLDLFSNNSSVTTYASAGPSTISVATMNLRQDNTVFDIADGAAATDLLVSSIIGNGANGNHALIKSGAGTMKLTGSSTFTGNVTINAGVLDLTSGALFTSAYNNANTVTVNTGGTLKLNSFGYSATASLGQLADYGARRVINGGTIEVTAVSETIGNDFTVGANGGTFRYNPADASNILTLNGNTNSNISVAGSLSVDAVGNISIGEVIDGAGTLTKTGAGKLSLSGTNNYTGSTTVNQGTLEIAGTGRPGTGAVINNTSLVFNQGSGVTSSVSNAVSGAGTITKTGAGAVALTGGITSTGAITAQEGTLRLSNNIVAPISVAAGATIAAGTNAAIGYFATDATTGSLTLAANSASTFRVSSGTNHDVIYIDGADSFTIAGTHTINPVIAGAPAYDEAFPVFDYEGTLQGNFSDFKLPTGTRFVLVNNLDTTSIDLVYKGGEIVWTGGTGDWDVDTTANWKLDGSPTNFFSADKTLFDDTASTGSVNLVGTISSTGITFNNNTLAYTLSGAALGGTGAVVKGGTAKTTFLMASNYSGGTTVNAGTLQIGDGGSTGDIGSGSVVVSTGATLEFNRANQFPTTPDLDYKTNVKLRNVSGAGDIVLTGGGILFSYPGTGLGFSEANSWAGFSGNLTVKGDSEFRTIRNGATAMGTGSVILGDATTSGILSTVEGNWTWTNNISLVGPANQILSRATGSGRSMKLQGVISGTGALSLEDSAGAMTDGNLGFVLTAANTLSGTLTIAVGTPVRIGGVPGNVDVAGTGLNADNSGSLGTAAVVNNGTLTFSRKDAHTVGNAISGSGSLRVGIPAAAGRGDTSTQVLTYTGIATYTGATTVNNGSLIVGAGASIAGSALSVSTGATLGGAGTVSAPVTVAGTVSPGTGVGTLTVGNTVITGTYACDISGAAADKLAAGTLDISGATLVITGTPTAASYTIATYTGTLSGSFTVTAPSGYALSYATPGEIKLVKTGTDFQNWIQGFFPGETNPAIIGLGADPDNDGITNGLEFVLKGGNPAVSGGAQMPNAVRSGANLVFSFERDDRAKGTTSGVTLTVQAGATLAAWPLGYGVGADTASSSAGVVISNDADANPDTVTVTIPTSGSPALFARLKVAGTP